MSESCDLYARMLLDRVQYKDLPVKPREIAQRLNIVVQELPALGDFDGYLLKSGDSFGIMLNSAIKSEERKNFTLAHELGHYEIPHHKGREFKCLSSSIGLMLGKEMELEANDFAAELLMPASFVAEQIENNAIGLETIRLIAKRCETSLTSSALRYVGQYPGLVTVVMSEAGKIKFSLLSNDMNSQLGKMIRPLIQKGASLNSLSLAYDFFKDSGSVQDSSEVKESVDISAWFPGLDYSRYECFENSVGLPNYNQVISLIWLKEKYYDDSDEDY